MEKILILLLFVSCSHKKTEINLPAPAAVPELKNQILINTVTADGDVKSSKITELNSDYFEVNLSSIRHGEAFIAQKDIEPSRMIGEKFHMVFFSIVKPDTSAIEFNTSTDFLNFMSEHGYDMVDQKKAKFTTEYTFKKKP